MKREIQLGMLLLVFLTILIFGFEALFLPLGVTVIVLGSKLRPGNLVHSFCSFTVFHECF